jgi:hypothetical protein
VGVKHISNIVRDGLKAHFTKKQVAKLIESQCGKIGILLSSIIIDGRELVSDSSKAGGYFMLELSVKVSDINYKKLMDKIGAGGGGGFPMPEIAAILKPFINDTMKTIPPSAIAALFELLGRELVLKFADEYGVGLSDISVKGGK